MHTCLHINSDFHGILLFWCLITPLMQTTGATRTPIISSCLTCGAIKSTGSLSCCARGGSWFGKCGGSGKIKRQHTWQEGIQACEARQSQAVMGQHHHQKSTNFYNDASMIINSRRIIVTAQRFAPTLAKTPRPTLRPIDTSVRNTFTGHTPAFESGVTTAIIHDSANILAPVPKMPPTNPSTANDMYINSDRVSMRESFTDITKSHTSISQSIMVRKCETVFNIITHILILFIIIVIC